MKPEEIIELAKKADVFLMFPDRSNLDRFAALHRQALIDSGELVPREKVEKEREFSKQLWYLLHGDTQHFEDAIDRARSQP